MSINEVNHHVLTDKLPETVPLKPLLGSRSLSCHLHGLVAGLVQHSVLLQIVNHARSGFPEQTLGCVVFLSPRTWK